MTDSPRQPDASAADESRRGFLRTTALAGAAAAAGYLAARAAGSTHVWQIDPDKCTACGNCATRCVLEPSAVKCVHVYDKCGYCRLCTGFFVPDPAALDEGAENQLCPTAAIQRRFIEEPYYEYVIDEPNCIGCGRCVMGCRMFGNGSMILQIRHDRCVDCNECAIARACPEGAISRVPLEQANRSGPGSEAREA